MHGDIDWEKTKAAMIRDGMFFQMNAKILYSRCKSNKYFAEANKFEIMIFYFFNNQLKAVAKLNNQWNWPPDIKNNY